MKLTVKQIRDLIKFYGFEYKIIIKNIDYKITIGKLKNGLFIIRDLYTTKGKWESINEKELLQLLDDSIYIQCEILLTTEYNICYLNDKNIRRFKP